MILLNNCMRRETLGGRCLRRRGSRSREKMNAVFSFFPFPLQGRSVGLRRRTCQPPGGPFISGAESKRLGWCSLERSYREDDFESQTQ